MVGSRDGAILILVAKEKGLFEQAIPSTAASLQCNEGGFPAHA